MDETVYAAVSHLKVVQKFLKNITIKEPHLDKVDSWSRKMAEKMQDGEPMEEDGEGEPRMQWANQ